MTEAVNSGRRMLVLLMLLFVAPLALAFWLYYGTGWRPLATTNHGELIAPVRALPQSATTLDANGAQIFHNQKWSLVIVSTDGCGGECQLALKSSQQVVSLLGRLQTRIQTVLLRGGPCCGAELAAPGQRDLIRLDASASPALLRSFPELQRARMIFVVDPLGNLMMRYDSSNDPRGLLDDLKHLLDLSRIG